MPRRWTEDERREHAALMQRLHQQRRFRHYTLAPELRAAIAAELRQLANPKATQIARRYDVAHSTVCAIARAEGIRLKPGRDPRRAERAAVTEQPPPKPSRAMRHGLAAVEARTNETHETVA